MAVLGPSPKSARSKRRQPLRHGEDELAVGHRREGLCREPLGEDQRTLLVAGGADAALFAGKGAEELVLPGAALDAGEAFVQIAAAQELSRRAGDDGSSVAVDGGKAFGIDALELGEVPLQQLEHRRVARAIEGRRPAARSASTAE